MQIIIRHLFTFCAGSLLLTSCTVSRRVPAPAAGPQVQRSVVHVTEGTGVTATLSPDGTRMALILLGKVFVVDRSTGLAVPVSDIATDAHEYAAAVWAPDSRRLLLTAGPFNPTGTSIFDTQTGRRDTVALRNGMHALWLPARDSILASYVVGDTTFIRRYLPGVRDRAELIKTIPHRVWYFAASPDARFLAYNAPTGTSGPTAATTLHEFDRETNQHRSLTTPGNFDELPAYSPDGRSVAFLSQRSGSKQVWLLARETGSARQLTRSLDVHRSPLSWTPDGQAVLYSAEGKLHLVDISGGRNEIVAFSAPFDVARWEGLQRPLIPAPGTRLRARGIVDPEISPNGQDVVFAALGDIWLASTSGGEPRRITSTNMIDESRPRWSPDGTRVAYVARQAGADYLLRIRHLQSDSETTAASPPLFLDYQWSPDARRIAFRVFPRITWTELESGKLRYLAPNRNPAFIAGFTSNSDSLVFSVVNITVDTLGNSKAEEQFFIAALQDSAAGRPWGARRVESWIRSVWSADLSRVAYVRSTTGYYTMAEGTGATPIPDPSPHRFSWTQDGSKLVYLSHARLLLRDVNTGSARELDVAPSFTVAAESRRLLIRNVRIVDGRGTPASPPSDVAVEHGRIHAIDRAGSLPNTRADTVIDAGGRILLPGLMDLHSHESVATPAFLYYGVLTVRDLGSPAAHIQAQRERTWAGNRFLPNVFHSGGFLTADYSFDRSGIGAYSEADYRDPAALAREIAGLRANGADLVKLYFRHWGFDAAASQAAHAQGIGVTSHFWTPGGFAFGLEGKEHSHTYYPRGSWTAPIRDDVVTLMRAAGTCMVPTLANYIWNTRGTSSVLPLDTAHFDDPATIHFETPAAREQLRTLMRDGLAPAAQKLWHERWQTDLESTGRLHKRNVHIAVGTDTGPSGRSVHMELELFVKAGLSPLEAIRAATYDAARCLRVEEHLGSIEVGKLADFFIVDGDPTASIRDAANVWIVVKGGSAITRAQIWDSVGWPAPRR